MERIVKFLGKHLFFPVIIRVCQWARCNQFLFYRVMWTLAYLFIAAQTVEEGSILGMLLFIPAFLLCCLVTYHKWDVPSDGNYKFVFLFLVLAVLVTILDLIAGNPQTDNMFQYFAVFAEYARLIQTIPPTETKKKEAKFTKKATDAA